MALSNADNPTAEKPEPKKAEPAHKPAAKLARASESGDAAVHQLLAERDVAARNDDKAALKAVDEKLADLGYSI